MAAAAAVGTGVIQEEVGSEAFKVPLVVVVQRDIRPISQRLLIVVGQSLGGFRQSTVLVLVLFRVHAVD